MATIKEEYIKDFQGRPLGILRYQDNGDIEAVEFMSRKIIGFYRKSLDRTTDFLGRIIAQGNAAVSLIYDAKRYLI
jgi:hypothetical protein